MQASRSSAPVEVGRIPRQTMSRFGRALGTFARWITGDLVRDRADGKQVLPPCCTTGNDPASASRLTSPLETQPPAQRHDLVTPDVGGILLSLTGQVVNDQYHPVPGAMMEFWQAHESYEHDNPIYLVHGHQHTDANGRYTLETVVPRAYGTRTPHVHVTVITPYASMVAIELFFPDTMRAYGLDIRRLNSRDRHIDRSRTISLGQYASNQYPGSFDFVIGTE